MRNELQLDSYPVKRRTLNLSPSPSGASYRDRIIHTGTVYQRNLFSDKIFYALDSTLPIDAPVDTNLGILTQPKQSNGSYVVNPKNLKYTVRFTTQSGKVIYRNLVQAYNTSITIDDGTTFSGLDVTVDRSLNFIGLEGAISEGDRWDILYPIDDGVRYAGKVESFEADDFNINGFSIINTYEHDVLEQVKALHTSEGVFNPSMDFDVFVHVKASNSLKVYSMIDISNDLSTGDFDSNNFSHPLNIKVAGDLNADGVSQDDTVIIRASLSAWKSFCNPSFLGSGFVPLDDSEFDMDDDEIVKPFFDFELNSATGKLTWYGNTLFGIENFYIKFFENSNSDDTDENSCDPNCYSTILPSVPFDGKLKYTATLIGETSGLTHKQAIILTDGGDASELHSHNGYPLRDNIYTKEEIYNRDEVYSAEEIDNMIRDIFEGKNLTYSLIDLDSMLKELKDKIPYIDDTMYATIEMVDQLFLDITEKINAATVKYKDTSSPAWYQKARMWEYIENTPIVAFAPYVTNFNFIKISESILKYEDDSDTVAPDLMTDAFITSGAKALRGALLKPRKNQLGIVFFYGEQLYSEIKGSITYRSDGNGGWNVVE